jgi:hypothetical protein
MKTFRDWFVNLLQIKKIIALILTGVFAFLSIVGKISTEQFITVFSMVVSFYFGQSSVRQTITESKKNNASQ